MTKLLNIDSVRPRIDRELILNGKKYKVEVIDVNKFFSIAEFGDRVKECKDTKEVVKILVNFVLEFIPEMERETLMSVGLDQLQLVADFIRDEVPDDMLESNTTTEPVKEDNNKGSEEAK